MPHCEEYTELISAALDGALSPREKAALEAHLAQCPACRALMADLAQLHTALDALPSMEPPQDLTQNIMAAVRDSSVTPFPAKKPLYWKKWLSSAAVLALIVAAGWGWRAGTFGGASSMAGAPNAATAQSADAAEPLPENAAEAAPADSETPAESRMRTAQPSPTSPSADAATAEGNGDGAYGTSGSQDMSAATQAKTAAPDAPPAEPSVEEPTSIAPRMFSVQGYAPVDDPAVGQTDELDEGLTDETDPGLPAAFSLTSAPPPEGETAPEENPAPAGGSGIAPLMASAPLTAKEALDRLLAEYPFPGCETWEYEDIEPGWRSPSWSYETSEGAIIYCWLKYEGPYAYFENTNEIRYDFIEWSAPHDVTQAVDEDLDEDTVTPAAYGVPANGGEITIAGN